MINSIDLSILCNGQSMKLPVLMMEVNYSAVSPIRAQKTGLDSEDVMTSGLNNQKTKKLINNN